MPAISIIVTTYRLGGLDALFDSLKESLFTDFELVIVDALYDYRKEIVAAEARDRFLHVRHLKLHPNPFPNFAPASERNAGIVASTGALLMFLDDYSSMPIGTLRRHVDFHRENQGKKVALQGPTKLYAMRDARFNYGSNDMEVYQGQLDDGLHENELFHAFDFGSPVDQLPPDPLTNQPAGVIPATSARVSNLSVPREVVLGVDGFKTQLDKIGKKGPQEFAQEFVQRLADADVEFHLDPEAQVAIAIPWDVKHGNHPSRRFVVTDQLAAALAAAPAEDPLKPRRRIAMIYGEFSSAIHGPFDLAGLYTRTGLTGSESSFFNLAGRLAERGHEVVVFCDCPGEYDHPSGWKAMPIRTLIAFPKVEGVHAVIAWNEPDYLKFAPPGAVRYCDQQLNDFGYCRDPEWKKLVDVWVSPSENHAKNVMQGLVDPATKQSMHVIPNSVDLRFFEGDAPKRDPHRVVWCSSPDRGLHHLLGMWPLVRNLVPDAELHIYYRLAPWIARMREAPDEQGQRARYVEVALERLREGFGVVVHDLVPNVEMASELRRSGVLAYPCDPMRYTEGFGVSVLDAAAAGCLPIISHVDALPEVHAEAAAICPNLDWNLWAGAIAHCLKNPPDEKIKAAMASHARKHSADAVTDMWEAILP